MKKNLNKEIDIREKRHREEMFNLNKNLEGKSTEEAMEMLDRMEERAQGLIGCIDEEIGELNGELAELNGELDNLEKESKKAIAWIIGVGAVVMIGVIVAVIKGWIT